MDREKTWCSTVDKNTHMVFEVVFSTMGLMHYTQTLSYGKPVLGIDSPGVLHFWGDIPLLVTDPGNVELLRVIISEIV